MQELTCACMAGDNIDTGLLSELWCCDGVVMTQ